MKSGLKIAGRWLPLALVAAALVAFFASGVWRHFSLEGLKAESGRLTAFVAAHPAQAVALYLTTYTVVVGLSLPAALILTLTAGFLFGPWWGGLAAVSGATLGSTAFFLVCRTAFGDVLRRHAGPKVQRLQDGIRHDAFRYMVTVRLIPAFPLWVVNLAAGLVGMPPRTFLAASFVGMAPSSLVYASIGASLHGVFASGRPVTIESLTTARVILPLVGLAALAGGSMLWRKLRPAKGAD